MSDKIEVKVNIPSYEYDIHSLVKAFYPDDAIVIAGKEKEEQEEEEQENQDVNEEVEQ